ncbi:MAG: coenzyme F430 synthase [Methanosarcinaceae archaeon]|nr:coenzyme F430 synthase [Methanosarcinaceae archaeon]
MSSDQKNIVVLDLTHGGIIIAQKLAELGCNVSAIDIYDTVSHAVLSDLRQNYGISASKESLNVEDFDIIVAPVHLDPNYKMLHQARESGKPVKTHHQVVGRILAQDKRISGSKIIEVTGTKAKTSTSSILADILSRSMDVVLHTSRGLEHWKNGTVVQIGSGLSIAPGSILQAVDMTVSADIVPDVYIFEVSIGGTGYADVGIFTTFVQDYRIASGTGWAGDAKLQLIDNAKEGSTIIINSHASTAIRHAQDMQQKMVIFSNSYDDNSDVTVQLKQNVINIRSKQGTSSATLVSGYDAGSYVTAMAAATAAALEFGIDTGTIATVLSEFRGLLGRMCEQGYNGRTLIDNSNSGMDIRSVEQCLSYALEKRSVGKIVMILGEEAAQVCEGLPPEDVSRFVEQQGSDIGELILVGDRMRAVEYKNAHYAGTLNEGLQVAEEITAPNDLILSCVKSFR